MIGRPRQRPTIDDPEAVKRLCDRLIAGTSLRTACVKKDVPSQTEVYIGMASNEAFRAVILRAREAQQHAEIDATIEMADKATPEDWQAVRLRIWARQWRAAKLAPKLYGDKTQLEHTGRDGGPIQVSGGLSGLLAAARAGKPDNLNSVDDPDQDDDGAE